MSYVEYGKTEDKKEQKQVSARKAYIINRLPYITQYVNNHYQEELNLVLIANKCNISKEYLARFFKKEMELIVETYLNNVRAEHVYQELKSRKRTLHKLQLITAFLTLEL